MTESTKKAEFEATTMNEQLETDEGLLDDNKVKKVKVEIEL